MQTNKIILTRRWSIIKKLHKTLGHKILWDNQDVQVKSMEINGDTATVNAYVLYKYVLNDYTNGFSESGTKYDMVFKRYNDKWHITEIKSDDEFDQEYYNTDIDVEKLVQENCSNVITDPVINNDQAPKTNTERLLPQWTYVAYQPSFHEVWRYTAAFAIDYNDCFWAYDSDCQNFGSQCVWFGFGGAATDQEAIDNKEFPMVNDGIRDWYQTSEQYDTPSTWVWTGCEYFAPYIDAGGYGYEGPFGNMGSAGDVSDAEIGDIIQIRDGSGVWYHTFVVDYVDGTAGSRANSNIWVSAHTTDRHSERLDTIVGSSQSNLRLVEIVYYCTE